MRFAALLFAALFACGAQAQAPWPSKPVRILVGFPPGTTGDIIARAMAPKLGEALGQPVLVENRPGAGSSIAAEAVAKSAPDGYTLLLSTIANAINPALYRLAFDFQRDLAPVALLAETPGLLVVHPGAPSSLRDLVDAAKAKPGALQFASSGNGTVTHLWGELLNHAAGIQLGHVPYKGSSQALTDLLAGTVPLMFTPASTVVAHVASGRMRALGVIGRRRVDTLPGVPTFAEAGIQGFESGLWFGLNAPAGTAPGVIDRVEAEALRALARADVRPVLAAQSIDVIGGNAAAYAEFLRTETNKWAGVAKAAAIKLE